MEKKLTQRLKLPSENIERKCRENFELERIKIDLKLAELR